MGGKLLAAREERDATVEKQDSVVSKVSVHLTRGADHHLELEPGVVCPLVPELDATISLLAAVASLSRLRTPRARLELVEALTVDYMHWFVR